MLEGKSVPVCWRPAVTTEAIIGRQCISTFDTLFSWTGAVSPGTGAVSPGTGAVSPGTGAVSPGTGAMPLGTPAGPPFCRPGSAAASIPYNASGAQQQCRESDADDESGSAFDAGPRRAVAQRQPDSLSLRKIVQPAYIGGAVRIVLGAKQVGQVGIGAHLGGLRWRHQLIREPVDRIVAGPGERVATLVPVGGQAVVEFQLEVAGWYLHRYPQTSLGPSRRMFGVEKVPVFVLISNGVGSIDAWRQMQRNRRR
jgi:hypothetical protein